MGSLIEAEAQLVSMSFALGVFLMVSYDLLRLFRLFVPHGSFWIGIEDFAYCIYCAAMTFSLLFRENSGIVRAYVIVCAFSSMILYDRIVSRSVFDLLKNIGRWIRIKMKRWKSPKREEAHGSRPQQEK